MFIITDSQCLEACLFVNKLQIKSLHLHSERFV